MSESTLWRRLWSGVPSFGQDFRMLEILHLAHVTKDPELKVMATCQLAGGLTASVGELPANS